MCWRLRNKNTEPDVDPMVFKTCGSSVYTRMQVSSLMNRLVCECREHCGFIRLQWLPPVLEHCIVQFLSIKPHARLCFRLNLLVL